MLLRGNKGKGREKGKMKKTEGYVVRRLEDEYLVLPSGRRTEEVNEVISLSETAGFIYMHAERAENVYELTQLVAEEYEIEPAQQLSDSFPAALRKWQTPVFHSP